MIEADRADHSRAKLDHDLIVPITSAKSFHPVIVLVLYNYSEWSRGRVKILFEWDDVNSDKPDNRA